MFDVPTYLNEQKLLVDAELDLRLPSAQTRPAVLHDAMRYSVLAGGKRVRPILCLAACEAVGGEREAAMPAALALEILHTYTLVHDDLPAMDDDDLRRGLPTTHKKYGEAHAILVGDALLTLAFEWTAETHASPGYAPGAVSKELAVAAGSQGVIAGQVEDLGAEGQAHAADLVDYIHRKKTGALLIAAVRMGAIIGGANDEQLARLTTYGEATGLAFQIADDLLNVTSTAAVLGKATGSDAERNKMTYVAVHGVDKAQADATRLKEEARQALEIFDEKADALRGIADYIVARTH